MGFEMRGERDCRKKKSVYYSRKDACSVPAERGFQNLRRFGAHKLYCLARLEKGLESCTSRFAIPVDRLRRKGLLQAFSGWSKSELGWQEHKIDFTRWLLHPKRCIGELKKHSSRF